MGICWGEGRRTVVEWGEPCLTEGQGVRKNLMKDMVAVSSISGVVMYKMDGTNSE